MPTNPTPLVFGNFYHIFNRGNNHENVFLQERNYTYFMELWWKYTFQIAETYAYCLLKNHFHAAVFIKNKEDLKGIKLKEPSRYFANCFNAYTRGVNNATGRSGALFERPFERIPVTDERYLMRLIVYVHQNPQKHKFVNDFRDWGYSSYHELIGDVPTRLQRDKMMELFGSREDFIRIHQEIQPLPDFDDEEDTG
jgi:REP element-mobilizing transposase RayT